MPLVFRNHLFLLLQLLTMSDHVKGDVTIDPPPGCDCTIEQCCSGRANNNNQWNCDLLEIHVGITGGVLNQTSFCEPYLDGTLNARTTVCDAILGHPAFDGRFVTEGSNYESSIYTVIEMGRRCSELLQQDQCNLKTTNDDRWGDNQTWDGDVSSWTAVGTCGRSYSTAQLTPNGESTLSFLHGFECSDDQPGTLDLHPGVYRDSSTIEAMPVCPNENGDNPPRLQFSDATAYGPAQKRWMCYDTTTTDFDGTLTAVRYLYINLGRLPCLYKILPPTDSPTPSSAISALSSWTWTEWLKAGIPVLVAASPIWL